MNRPNADAIDKSMAKKYFRKGNGMAVFHGTLAVFPADDFNGNAFSNDRFVFEVNELQATDTVKGNISTRDRLIFRDTVNIGYNPATGVVDEFFRVREIETINLFGGGANHLALDEGMVMSSNSTGPFLMTVTGNEGNDFIGANQIGDSSAHLRVLGMEGRDTLLGGAGDDLLQGGTDGDHLIGGFGNDVLWGEDGNDVLYGEADNDVLEGGTGADTLLGGTGDDTMLGGTEADSITGDEGEDWMEGGHGVDWLDGGGDDDVVFGGSHDDTIYGGGGHDELDGGSGDDVLDGGQDDDVLHGGDGDDTFVFDLGSGFDEILDFQAGPATADRIDLSAYAAVAGYADISDLTLVMDGPGAENTLIDLKGSNSILLWNVEIADLDNSDFIF